MSVPYIRQYLLSTRVLKYILRETQDIPLQSLLFSSNIWQCNWKMISKSGTRPSWPLVNVKLTHFIFSHLLFSVHTSPVSARSLLKAYVSVSGGWRSWGFTWAESSGVAELVRPAKPDLKNVRYGVDANGRCELEGPFQPMYMYSECLHTMACACVWAMDPSHKMWHPYLPLLCIRWSKGEPSPSRTFLPGAPQMLHHALMVPVTVW